MIEKTRYIVSYSAYRYNDGSANNADIRREVTVDTEAKALSLVERINRSAQGYKDSCDGARDDDEDDSAECSYEEKEEYLIDWLIGGACGGFFKPGARAFAEHYRRESLAAQQTVEAAP